MSDEDDKKPEFKYAVAQDIGGSTCSSPLT